MAHSGYNVGKDFSGETVLLHAHADWSFVQDPGIHENEEHAQYAALPNAQKYNDDAMEWGDGYSPAWTREEYSFL
jgi:hypothetical protein